MQSAPSNSSDLDATVEPSLESSLTPSPVLQQQLNQPHQQQLQTELEQQESVARLAVEPQEQIMLDHQHLQENEQQQQHTLDQTQSIVQAAPAAVAIQACVPMSPSECSFAPVSMPEQQHDLPPPMQQQQQQQQQHQPQTQPQQLAIQPGHSPLLGTPSSPYLSSSPSISRKPGVNSLIERMASAGQMKRTNTNSSIASSISQLGSINFSDDAFSNNPEDYDVRQPIGKSRGSCATKDRYGCSNSRMFIRFSIFFCYV